MKNLLIFVFSCIVCLASAQDSLKPVKKIRINDINAFLSANTELNMRTGVDDFRAMYPGSGLLQTDLSSYSQSFGGSSLNGLSFFAGASFKFSDKTKTGYRKNVRLRTGLSVNSCQLYTVYQQERITPFDSLSPSFIIDSVTIRSMHMSYNGTQLKADVSFLWSTNQEKRRLAVYTGMGITGGMSVRSYGSVGYTVYRDLKLRGDKTQNSGDMEKTERTYEAFRGVKSYGFSAYVPLGVDLRLGNTRTFWKMAHIYYELKPMYNLLVVPAAKTFSNLGLQHGWGLRFTV